MAEESVRMQALGDLNISDGLVKDGTEFEASPEEAKEFEELKFAVRVRNDNRERVQTSDAEYETGRDNPPPRGDERSKGLREELHELTVDQLKDKAKRRDLKGVQRGVKKDELVEILAEDIESGRLAGEEDE